MNIEDNPTQYQVADPGKLLSWTIHAMPRITQKLAVRKKRRNKRKSALLYGGFDHKKVTSRRNWSSPFIILLLNNKNCSELRTKRARFWYKLIKFRLTNPNLRKTDTTGIQSFILRFIAVKDPVIKTWTDAQITFSSSRSLQLGWLKNTTTPFGRA